MNVAKHAEATKTEVSLDVGADAVTLVVIDDGVGMTDESSSHSGGLGLRNIRERASRLGGEVRVLRGGTKRHPGPLGGAALPAP